LLSMVGLIPDGVVVFLPSYAFLDKVKAFWAKSGLISKLADRKEVSYTVLEGLHSADN
jgi:chromosome transmission fidelity protein 1